MESESVVEGDAMEEVRAGAKLADIERDHILATWPVARATGPAPQTPLEFQYAACGTSCTCMRRMASKFPSPKPAWDNLATETIGNPVTPRSPVSLCRLRPSRRQRHAVNVFDLDEQKLLRQRGARFGMRRIVPEILE